ncbi:MAG: dTMP kinase [Ignavibacteria bacterium]|jgi:dTMP kinase|nr:dTMP kinase [Ignavibacteria bacterium]MDH7528471.1 dTMP kinase [Ignavibacteria bacterium]NPV10572.1 dTMP kinase [Ignavibacteria bacterium]
MFITFEGIDASGKTTQVKLLENYLREQNFKVIVVREPGGTKLSEQIRNILLSKENFNMFKECEIFLFSASRAQLVREVIIPKLNEGYIVISDRFHDSTTAYQGTGRNINLEDVYAIHRIAIDNCIPDLTYFIDIPFEESLRRKNLSNLSPDRIESQGKEFFEKVREGYLEIQKREPERFKVINGLGSPDEIHKKIVQIFTDKLISLKGLI